MDGLTALGMPLLRRSVIDDVTGKPVITSPPTGEVVSRSALLPLGITDEGRMTVALPQAVLGAYDAARFPGQVLRGEKGVFDPATGHVSQEAMDAANGIAGIAMTGGLGGAAVRQGETALGSGPIRAYHGSPHSFDRFSSKAMGTGEGAQAYGAGTYFAEAEPVALGYRDRLTPAGQKGSMYEVGIDASPEAFIDHAKPLSQQSQMVQDAFASLGRGKTVPSWRPDKPGMREVGGITFDPEMTGMQAYQRLDSNPAAATQKLSDAGIAGIRYRDAGSSDGSRSATNNLVVFNDDLVSILRKYGLAGMIGGGAAAASMMQPGDAQASSPPLTALGQ